MSDDNGYPNHGYTECSWSYARTEASSVPSIMGQEGGEGNVAPFSCQRDGTGRSALDTSRGSMGGSGRSGLVPEYTGAWITAPGMNETTENGVNVMTMQSEVHEEQRTIWKMLRVSATMSHPRS